MNRHDELKIELISSIKDEIIDKHTRKRIELSEKPRKKGFRKGPFMRYCALAAAFLLVLVSITATIMISRYTTPEKQIPVYQGMTVSSTPPTIEEIKNAHFVDLSSHGIINLSSESVPSKTDKVKDENNYNDEKLEEALRQDMLSVSTAAMYYAKPGEDIYIHIYLSNPDDFEIISFTLNGVTYQSFMFEDGSNLEHLILKYNVGASVGIVEYTLDAIKYIDGTVIKDVLLNANKTVKVAITPAIPEALIVSEKVGFDSLELSVSLSEISALVAANGFKSYAVLFDGEDIISKTELTSTEQNVKFDSLNPNTEYCYALVTSYGDGEGSSNFEILYSKDFVTKSPISIENINIEATDVIFSIVWADDYIGEKVLTSLSLYEGEALIRELSVTDTRIGDLPFDRVFTLTAKYLFNASEHSYSVSIDAPRSSQGLSMTDGVITGIGSCYDSVLYLNAPIGNQAFANNNYIKKVYCGSGVTSIGDFAFENCAALETVELSKKTATIGMGAFWSNKSLTSIKLQEGIIRIDASAFRYCRKLTDITLPSTLEYIGPLAFYGCESILSIIIPDSVTELGDFVFEECINLSDLKIGTGINVIPRGAFRSCNIREVTIPASVHTIGARAFYNCTDLNKVTIKSEDRLVIEESSFKKCTSLDCVIIPKCIEHIDAEVFSGCAENIVIYIRAEIIPEILNGWEADVKEIVWGYKD